MFFEAFVFFKETEAATNLEIAVCILAAVNETQIIYTGKIN